MSPLRPLLVALAALAVAAPSALAAPHWSAPDTVFGSTSQQSAFQALSLPDGTPVVVGTDGATPLASTGDAAGHFGASVPAAPAGNAVSGVTGAVAPDGTLAVAWLQDGVARVATRPADSRAFGAPQTLAGSGAVEVSIAYDSAGGLVAATRERGTNRYAIRVNSAPAGGGFGDGTVYDEGASAADHPVVGAGADGTVAVTWRRSAPRYRIRAIVRPPGGSFSAPAFISPSDNDLDVNNQVVVDPSGTVLAGWDSQAGAFVVQRPAGGDFGAPQQLGAPGFGLSLAAARDASALALWDAGDALRFADRPPGGAFGAAGELAPSSGGQVVTQLTAAFDAAGKAYAAWQPPDTQAVRVSVRNPGPGSFPAPETLGYGIEGANGISVAAGPPDRAVVAWRTRDGSVVGVVRSETADTTPDEPTPASTPPGAKDTKKPSVKVLSSRTVRFGRHTQLTLRIRCSEPCSIAATGFVRLTSKRTAPLRPYTRKTRKNGAQTLTFKLGPSSLRSVRSSLRTHRSLRATLDVSAKDAASNTRRTLVHLTVRR